MTSVRTGVAVAAPDLAAIKQRQQTTWASGDFGIIGTTLQIVGETLCEAADQRSGSKVLDGSAGTRNSSLAAARRWCDVTSTDYVPSLLEDGRRRASAERLKVTFREADVEALPFDDGAFDAVLSSFGVMFAPDHARSASEMLRVVRSGGTIALANWTPAGFIGRMFGVIGRHVPPPAGVTPPARWGLPEHLELLFGDGAARIRTTPRDFMFRYLSAAHCIDVFRTWYGPVHKAFAALPAKGQDQLDADMHELIAEFNEGGDGTMVVPGE